MVPGTDRRKSRKGSPGQRERLGDVASETLSVAIVYNGKTRQNTSVSFTRKIIHVDMDAFYASVEQRDNPSLRGKPVAVGGMHRGVVAAASYEARKYGVHSAMPSKTAARKCPGLIFVKPRFEVYRQASVAINEVFRSYSGLVEPLSLDEAYLDVTEPLKGPPSATLIARAIKEEIKATTGLTASAGVSYNKFLAKVASAAEKPDGLTVITPEQAAVFIDALPIAKFFGVGPVTAKKMHDEGIRTGADLKAWDEERLVKRFGRSGRYYYSAANGLDDRPVRSQRVRKSLGAERTFNEDISEPTVMMERLTEIAEEVARRLGKRSLSGQTVTLKIKDLEFNVTTRQTTSREPVCSADEILRCAEWLLWNAPSPPEKPVRLLGLTVSKLLEEADLVGRQLSLHLSWDEDRS
ncbi:MAG: DNA polymerase-4 [Rhodothermales bacterium]|jgi:DNA polymerase-4